MVPENWEHPRDYEGHYIPLYDGFSRRDKEWQEEWEMWQKGKRRDWSTKEWKDIEPKYRNMRYSDFETGRPNPDDYMPEWPEEQKTHLMMYETCSEGTPISPPMKTPEELARWLADNKASAFGHSTATYEQWLATCKAGYAIGMVYSPEKGLRNGVEFSAE